MRYRPGRQLAHNNTALMGWVENTILIAMALVIPCAVAMVNMNPPERSGQEQQEQTEPTPLYFELRWNAELPHDLDIQVACANTVNGVVSNKVLVFFRNPKDKWLTLEHDSTGSPRSARNVEEVHANSKVITVPNRTRCMVNTHLYDRWGGELPIKAALLAIVNKGSREQKTIARVEFPVSAVGEECSVLAVEWDDKGNYIPESVKTYPELQTTRFAPAAASDAPTCTPAHVAMAREDRP